MDIRYFIAAIESYLEVLDYGIQEMDAVDSTSPDREYLTESDAMPEGTIYSTWIDCFGVELSAVEDVLVESVIHGTPTILVETTEEEFRATWDDLPSPMPLETLIRLMESMDEFEAYFIGPRIIPTRQQAIATVSSMVRNFSDL